MREWKKGSGMEWRVDDRKERAGEKMKVGENRCPKVDFRRCRIGRSWRND